MAQVSFGSFSKKRNSTKQPAAADLTDIRNPVYLKENCSQDRPIFQVTGNNFTHNYCEWEGRYYFIEDIISLRNNEIEIHCVMDPLATYKTEIINSTQFVSYSAGGSRTTSQWLTDNRVPLLRSATVSSTHAPVGFFDPTGKGFYVLSVVGYQGAVTYECSIQNIKDLLASISSWENAGITAAVNKINVSLTGGSTDVGDSIDTLNSTLATIGEALINCGFIGNAYADAPSCIRSCIWVPFYNALSEGSSIIWLGNYDTHVGPCKILSTKPLKPLNATVLNIPWQNTGWRRAACEEVYLYLPLVGMISIPSNEIIQETAITIDYSVTATDGCVAYEVTAGNQKIGTFAGNCCSNYPIGISQQASAGQIVQTAAAGMEKMISTGIQAGSSINPAAWGFGAAQITMQGIQTDYDIINAANTKHNSYVGSLGGGAASGLSTEAYCFTVSHPTVIAAGNTAYNDTMGEPVMKSISLTTCTGFTQCANAHVEAPATAGELDAIDAMLNSGFYIE